MNTLTSLFSSAIPRPRNHDVAAPRLVRPVRRERDFGIGYGSSSGYAAAVRYAPEQTLSRFRFG
jgi:hypothetical protein